MDINMKKELIFNENGVHIATVYGEPDINAIANFFIKTPIQKNQKDTE